MVTVMSRQLSRKAPPSDVDQVEAMPTPGQAPGIGQVCSLQATRRVQVVRSGQDPHWATVAVLVEGKGRRSRLVQPHESGRRSRLALPVAERTRLRSAGTADRKASRHLVRYRAVRVRKGVPMEPHEEEEGWFTDPFGRHEARWLSFGTPTKLVRDGDVESYDEPPDEEPTSVPERIEPEWGQRRGRSHPGRGRLLCERRPRIVEPTDERRRPGGWRPSRGEYLARARVRWPASAPARPGA